jgi:hypothetical protein
MNVALVDNPSLLARFSPVVLPPIFFFSFLFLQLGAVAAVVMVVV